MRTRLRTGILVFALLAPCAPAAAQDAGYVGIEQRLTPAQLQEIGLTARQVELLDRYLREDEFATPAHAGAEALRPDASRLGAAQLLGLDAGPIRSRLKGRVAGWEPGTVFALENGQRWQVLKGRMRLREPVEAPEILVVPGIAGRWFLQVDEDLPKARVVRID